MNFFSSITLSNPIFLVLGCFVLAIMGGVLYKTHKRSNFSETDLLRKIFHRSSWWYRVYIGSIFCMTLTVFIYIAWPIRQESYETIKKNGIDIEIVMDLSYSMIAEDIKPSRIEVAKSVFQDFILGLETDRVGLILFSGKPFQSVPLSYDYTFLHDFVGDISIDTIDQRNPQLQWTAIGDALVLASDVLTSDESIEREKVIILITDGEANKWVEPLLALKLIQEKGIKTYTIGVGKDDITTISAEIAPWVFQNIEIWGIDEEILQKIASETGAEYYRADSAAALESILERIAELEKKEIEIEVRSSSNSWRPIISLLFCIISLVLMYCIFIKSIRHA